MKKFLLHTVLLVSALSSMYRSGAQNIYTYAGVAGAAGYSGDGGYAAAAHIGGPRSIAIDAAGNIYFADQRENVVRRINSAGLITTIAGNGTAATMGDGGPATAAELNVPAGLAIDRAGNIYISERVGQVVRKINTSGTISTIAGTGTGGYSGDGGAATSAQLNTPVSLAIDTLGNIYIADASNYAIRMVSPGGTITTIAGSGTPGYTGDGGPATAATLGRPTSIALDAAQNLIIADNTDAVVRKITMTTGTIATIAGIGTAGYSGDGGAATAAALGAVSGVATDAAGNVLVSTADNRVRLITLTGIISTIAGNGAAGYSGDGGAATLAQLNNPQGVAEDAAGNIYISDYNNNVIRRTGDAVRGISITGSTVCAGSGPIHFTATVYADSTPHYQWQVNGVAAGTDSAGFTDLAPVTGSRVRCILLDSAGTDTAAISNTIRIDTSLTAGAITGPATLCTGVAAVVRDSAAGMTARWALTDTVIARLGAGAGGIRITALAPGTDTVYVIAANACGADTASLVFTITANPYGLITGPDTLCAGSTATYTDTSMGSVWHTRPAGSGTIDSVTGVFTATAGGGGMGGGGRAIITYGTSPTCYASKVVTIAPAPMAAPISGDMTVTTGATIVLTDMAPGGVWSSSNTAVATVDASGTVTGVTAGAVTITYTLTSPGGCTASSTHTVAVLFPGGVAAVQAQPLFQVFPNPASGNVYITWGSMQAGEGSIAITDVTGREIYNGKAAFGNAGQQYIDASAFVNGVYMVTITAGGSTYHTKLAIAK